MYPSLASPSYVPATQGGTSTCEGRRAIVRHLAVKVDNSRACVWTESSVGAAPRYCAGGGYLDVRRLRRNAS
jgi:hypothetical protein